MIDFHCHIDLYPDPRAVLREVVERGCFVLAVTTTPLAVEGTRKIIGDTARVRVAVGLHPELVAARSQEVGLLCDLIGSSRCVGESGLDGTPRLRDSLEQQRRVFNRVLRTCEDSGGRIMSIHSRGAALEVLDALEAHPRSGAAVLHWYSGTIRQLQRAIDRGCWFSVGPAMLDGKKGRRLVEMMPPSRVLTETDGPFTRKHRGQEALYPWDVETVVADLARLWGSSMAETSERLLSNLRQLVSGPEGASIASPDHAVGRERSA